MTKATEDKDQAATDITSEKEITRVEERKVTWGYTRKVNLGNYESEEVSVYLTEAIPEQAGAAQWVVKTTESHLDALKTEVWSALGLDFGFNPEGRPSLVPKVPPAQPAQVSAGPPPTQPRGAVTPPPLPPPPPQQQPQQGMQPQQNGAVVGVYANMPRFCGDTWDKGCGDQGGDWFYDNRSDNDQKLLQGQKVTPDFKCKKCGKGGFRPGSYEYNQGVGAAPTQVVPPLSPF